MEELLRTGLPLVHACATLFMTGVIWLVQLCQYPLFLRVGAAEFPVFHREHMRRIAWVVGPAMAVESISALGCVLLPPAGVDRSGPIVGLALLATIWLATILVQIPQHRALTLGANRPIRVALIRWNWIRTLLWSARAVLAASWI